LYIEGLYPSTKNSNKTTEHHTARKLENSCAYYLNYLILWNSNKQNLWAYSILG